MSRQTSVTLGTRVAEVGGVAAAVQRAVRRGRTRFRDSGFVQYIIRRYFATPRARSLLYVLVALAFVTEAFTLPLLSKHFPSWMPVMNLVVAGLALVAAFLARRRG